MSNITKVEELGQEIYDKGIDLINYPFQSNKIKGLTFICNNKATIGISKQVNTNTEKVGILAEELSHYEISPNKDITNDHKNERLARLKGYEKVVPFEELLKAISNNIIEIYDLAEYFNVTYEYMIECIKNYKVSNNL